MTRLSVNFELYNENEEEPRRLLLRGSGGRFYNLSVGNNKRQGLIDRGETNICYSLQLEEMEALHSILGGAIKKMKENDQT